LLHFLNAEALKHAETLHIYTLNVYMFTTTCKAANLDNHLKHERFLERYTFFFKKKERTIGM